MSSLQIRVIPCNKASVSNFTVDNVTCATDKEIEDAISKHFIQVITYKQTFDESQFSGSPITDDLDITTYNIAKNYSYFKEILVQRVNITTKDQWFSSRFKSNQYSYYNMLDSKVPITGEPKAGSYDMLTLLYSKDENEEVITRQVTSLIDILSKVGGIATFIMALTFFITQKFQISLFERSLAKQLFQVSIDEIESPQANFQGQMHNSQKLKKHISSIHDDETLRGGGEDQRFKRITENIFYRQPLDINFIKLRLRVFIEQFLCCFKKDSLQKRNAKKNLEGYTIALREQLDIVKLVKNVRKLKVLIYLFLSKQHRQLFPYLSFNLMTDQKIQNRLNNKSFVQKSSLRRQNTMNLEKISRLQNNVKYLLDGSKTRKKDQLLLQLIMDEWKGGVQNSDNNEEDSYMFSNINDFSSRMTKISKYKNTKSETLHETKKTEGIFTAKGKIKPKRKPSKSGSRRYFNNENSSDQFNDE